MEMEKSRQLLSSEEDLLKTIKSKRKKSKENFGQDSDSDNDYELDNAHKVKIINEYIEKEYL